MFFLVLVALLSVACSNTPKEGYIKEQTVGTITEAEFDKMIEISNKKDSYAFGQMIMEGKMFVINSNTHFKVIEGKFGKSKCKVKINGIERELWINNDHIKK